MYTQWQPRRTASSGGARFHAVVRGGNLQCRLDAANGADERLEYDGELKLANGGGPEVGSDNAAAIRVRRRDSHFAGVVKGFNGLLMAKVCTKPKHCWG